jgi:hypothetical protein
LYVNSRSATIVVGSALLGYANAVERATRLFGWATDAWKEAHVAVLASVAERVIGAAAAAGSTTSPRARHDA